MSIMTMVEAGPLCNCGCGEHLPVGSMRKYKRGHRARVNRAESERIDMGLAQNGVFDGYNFRQDFNPAYNHEPINLDAWETTQYTIGDDGEFTLDDAAQSVPNDPISDIFTDPPQQFNIPRGVKADIEGKLAFMLTMTATAWSMADPVCGGALAQNAANITKSVTPLILQSPGIVQWFQKTSNIMLYINALMAVAPVAIAIFNHHIVKPNPVNPAPDNGQFGIGDMNAYRIQ
jgi:hypothetical protein